MMPDQVISKSYYGDNETQLLYWQKKIFNWLFSLLSVLLLFPFPWPY